MFNTLYNETQVEKKDNRLIDFKKVLNNQIEQTETSIPYINQHVEDVMFVNNKYLAALEYTYFRVYEKTQENDNQLLPLYVVKQEDEIPNSNEN